MRRGLLGPLLLFSTVALGQGGPWPTAEWPVSSPEQQGMEPARLEEASRFIEANCPTRFSLLVVRHGHLVFERYYNGGHADQAVNIKSMSKSVLSVLTGIALDEGLLRGLDQKLAEFYPEYFQAGLDPRKLDINLANLLTMTAGFEWAENTAVSARCFTSSDWHRCVIEMPLTSNPGEVFNYSTGLTHLLSGILTKASGSSTLAYATSRLFAPLGITCYRWTQDPRGYYFGGSEVWLTARDLTKFGLLSLRNGRWEDRTVVSEGWLAASTRLSVRTNHPIGDYGYLWWRMTVNGCPTVIASGFGGQNIFLVPDLDLMMVTTARSDIPNQEQSVYTQPYEILGRYVVPAVSGEPPQFSAGSVVNAADYTPRLAAGSFVAAFGRDFSPASTTWDYAMPADRKLPTGIGGVRVRVGGRDAYPSYVSPSQVNFLLPPDLPAGRHRLEVTTTWGRATEEIAVADFAPAWFGFARDGRVFASPRPVRPGEVIELYASGLGPTDPPAPAGAAIEHPLPLVHQPEVSIAGRPATLLYAGLVYAGVYQLNVRVPEDVPPGEAPVRLRIADAVAAGEATLEIAP